MADEKTIQQKDAKPSFWKKLTHFFKNLPANIARPFLNMWRELRKVTWPTKHDLVSYTLIVVAFMVFMGVVIGLLDMGSSALIQALIALKS